MGRNTQKPIPKRKPTDVGINALAISSDGKRIATANADGTVLVLDADSCEELLTLQGHDGPVMCLTFAPHDGKLLLISGGIDKTLRLWNGKSPEALPTR